MHIPPYYKRPSFQRFFAGICIGTIIGYLIFIYMFGELQEKWIEENLALRITRFNAMKHCLKTIKR